MTIQAVVKMGNQQLSSPSHLVTDWTDQALKQIIHDMQDTMHETGGVGIAAPQLGYQLRVVMFGFEANSRYPKEKSVPFTVLINPVIEVLSDELVDGWEGCLSIPGLRGLVPRYKKIRYEGYDLEGNHMTRVAEDFHARVVQHE